MTSAINTFRNRIERRLRMNASFDQSNSIAEIAKSMVKFHRTCPPIPKTESNPYLRSKYADLSGILAIVTPHLVECGLSIIQSPIEENGLMTMLVHESGEWIKTIYYINPLPVVVDKDNKEKAVTPQSIGSAITYQRRYALQSMLNLNIEHDNDGSDVTAKPEKKQSKTAKQILEEQKAAKAAEANKDQQKQVQEPTDQPKEEPPLEVKEAVTGGTSQESFSAPIDGPCSPVQITQVKELLMQWARSKKGVDVEFVQKLKSTGRQKIADLTARECDQLIQAISVKSLDAFFESQLAKK